MDHTTPDQLSGDELDQLAELHDDLAVARGENPLVDPYVYGGD